MSDEQKPMDSTPSTSSGQASSPQAEEKQLAEESAVKASSSAVSDAKAMEAEEAPAEKQPETELEKCGRERAEYLAGWQRAKADFLNYQKDERRRQEEFLKWTQVAFVEDLLPVLDSFDLAILEMSKTPPDDHIKGFFLIKSQLDEILKRRGLEPIKAVGEKFDPEFHEAIATIEDPAKKSGTIVEEIQKGYILNGRVLRPSKVKIVK